MATIIVDGTQSSIKERAQLEHSIQSFEPHARILTEDQITTWNNITRNTSETIVIIADTLPSVENLQSLIIAARQENEITVLSSSSFNEASPSQLTRIIAFDDGLPAAIAVPQSKSFDIKIDDISSAGQIAASILSQALLLNAAINTSHCEEDYSIGKNTRSTMLKVAIETLEIEDLFPHHAWSYHQEESLAACYHTLAATFIRLGEYAAAEECLNQSEAFEDSPRSLALKGLISKLHGETLGAVANMVSSLQQYEQRKKEIGIHYLNFKPQDIEVVNFRLKEGLEALNKRDNNAALNKFTEAVFNFDSFYADLGLDKVN